MSVNYFTDEQIEELKKNPYVQSISKMSIKFTKDFKDEFWKRYTKGEAVGDILRSLGINPSTLGKNRTSNLVQLIKKDAGRPEGFEDKRQRNKGRPPAKEMDEMTDKEKLEYMEHKVKYMEQQIEFIKKICQLNQREQWNQQQQDTKSSEQ